MAVTAFPTWAYNQTAAPQLVLTQAALTALGPTWVLTPFPGVGQIAPADVGLTDTDIRLQQILVESRITNQLLYANAINIAEDPSVLRADVVAVDVALTS